MANTLQLEIATASDSMHFDDVSMVTLPGIAGQLGVYPDHIPLVTPIEPGEVIVQRDKMDQFFAVGEGIAEITGRRVVILTDMAIDADQLDESKAKRELELEQEKLKMELSEKEYAAVSGRVARLVAQLTTLRDHRP